MKILIILALLFISLIAITQTVSFNETKAELQKVYKENEELKSQLPMASTERDLCRMWNSTTSLKPDISSSSKAELLSIFMKSGVEEELEGIKDELREMNFRNFRKDLE